MLADIPVSVNIMNQFLVSTDVWTVINQQSHGKTFHHFATSLEKAVSTGNLSIIGAVCQRIVNEYETKESATDFYDIGTNLGLVFDIHRNCPSSEICMYILHMFSRSRHFDLQKYSRLFCEFIRVVFRDKDIRPVLSYPYFEYMVLNTPCATDFAIEGLAMVADLPKIRNALPLVQWYHQKFSPSNPWFYKQCILYSATIGDVSLLKWVIQTVGINGEIPNRYFPLCSASYLFQTTDVTFYETLYTACPALHHVEDPDLCIRLDSCIIGNDIETVRCIVSHYDSRYYLYEVSPIINALLADHYQILDILVEKDTEYMKTILGSIFRDNVREPKGIDLPYFFLHLKFEVDEQLRTWVLNLIPCKVSPLKYYEQYKNVYLDLIYHGTMHRRIGKRELNFLRRALANQIN